MRPLAQKNFKVEYSRRRPRNWGEAAETRAAALSEGHLNRVRRAVEGRERPTEPPMSPDHLARVREAWEARERGMGLA
jgi:hypothetical protein